MTISRLLERRGAIRAEVGGVTRRRENFENLRFSRDVGPGANRGKPGGPHEPGPLALLQS